MVTSLRLQTFPALHQRAATAVPAGTGRLQAATAAAHQRWGAHRPISREIEQRWVRTAAADELHYLAGSTDEQAALVEDEEEVLDPNAPLEDMRVDENTCGACFLRGYSQLACCAHWKYMSLCEPQAGSRL